MTLVYGWSTLLGIGFCGAVTFISLYARRGWWRTPVGRNLMLLLGALAGLLGLSLIGFAWRPPAWLWLGGIAVLDAAIWWLAVILIRLR